LDINQLYFTTVTLTSLDYLFPEQGSEKQQNFYQ